MAYEQLPITSPFEPGTGKSMLRPEDVTSHDLPVAMRGYDREQVDGFLHRVSEAYLLTWRQAVALRERLRTVEEEQFEVRFAAQGEAEASSKAVAELSQRCSTAEDQLTKTRDQLTETRNVRSELSTKLDLAERERAQALAELREVSERASDLEKQLQDYQRRQDAAPDAPVPAVADEEAATLLVAAVRAAEDVREASRTRAAETLVRARERAMQLHDEAERERVALGEVVERREQAAREANETLAGLQERREQVEQAEREANETLAGLQERREQAEQAEREANETLAGLEERRAQAEREANETLAGLEERRAQVEREANEILADARAEAERVATSAEDERDRVRELLAGALQSLDADGSGPDGLVSDLSSRLHEPTS